MTIRRFHPLRALAACLVAGACLAFALPFFWMILTSFKSSWEIFSLPPSAWPQEWRWDNYVHVWRRAGLRSLFVNSVLVTGSVILSQLITSTVAGYAFARLRFRGSELLFWLYLASMFVPDHLTLIPSFRLLNFFGLVDTRTALVLPFAAGAVGTLIMRRQFLAVPPELEEAARLDGCSTWALFRHVLLPSVAPGLRAVATFMFLFSWSNLLWPLVMTHRAEVRTLPVGLAFLHDEMGGYWHLLMAGSVLAAAPAIVILWVLSDGLRHLEPEVWHE